MKLSVIIPVHNARRYLRVCLEALAASSRAPDEVVIVDDASTDLSPDLAMTYEARVIRLEPPPRGPAFARNRGAEIAQGDVLVFIDSDVAVHGDALARIHRHLSKHPEIAGVFGSYDADPLAGGLVTRYKNLLHHHVHQRSSREASTFWAGCGAIRREVFSSLGGFNESYARPSVEDIELGARLHSGGYPVRLCPDVQVKHLKRWTLTSLLKSDILDRAIPWSRLILRNRHLPGELNLDERSRWSAIAAWAALVCLPLGLRWPLAWAGTLSGVGVVAALNAHLYRFFWRQGGGWFAMGAASLHAFYLVYSSLIFVLIGGETLLSGRHAWSLRKRPEDWPKPHNPVMEQRSAEGSQAQQESDA